MTPPAEPNVGVPGAGVPAPPHRRLFLALVSLGVVGILGGLPLNAALIAEAAPDEPLAAALVISSVSLLIPVALGSLAFVTLGPRVGLDAPVLRAAVERRPWWPQLRAALPLAAGLAAAGFAVIAALDFTVFDSVRARIEAPDVPFGAHLLASLYGGIVEELLVRAGLMTVLAWLLVVIGRRPRGSAPTWVVWTAIVAAALAFGALHLPATAVLVELTPLTVARALLLNAPAGIVFGWLAWRRGLEVAMASHLIADVLIITTQHLLT